MAWANPSNVATGDVLTSSNWNQAVVENTKVLRCLANVQQTFLTGNNGVANSATYVDVNDGTANLAVTITPTYADSKILVTLHLCIGVSAATQVSGRLLRGSTPIGGGVTASLRQGVFVASYGTDNGRLDSIDFTYLDSPATTSATTYKVQLNAPSATVYVNRSGADTDATTAFRGSSNIIAREIPA